MILCNARLAVVSSGLDLVLLSVQRRAEGREPLLGQRSEEQSGYWEAQPAHLHHPAIMAITATQPTATLLTDLRATHSRVMGIQATRDTLLTQVPRPMDTQPPMDTKPTQDTPLSLVPRAMDIRARRDTFPTPVPVMPIPRRAIPTIALRRTGHRWPGMGLSLLAEFRPKIHP
jgi:hypothetical protein